MKTVLSYAPSEQQFIPVPPLGIAVLSAYLKERGISVDTMDLELELWLSQNGLSSTLAQKSINEITFNQEVNIQAVVALLLPYNIVSFSLMGKRQLQYVKHIIEELKNQSSEFVAAIIGGSLLSDENVEDIAQQLSVDYAIVGEG
ncbi:MAG: cobalamin B12-binding domain-containing protein [Puniceicoccales bacterium]|jgi:hypothetical protein|nr:cobalamin B12-binding domain-containing protein [Puniceicoccales bacterium]